MDKIVVGILAHVDSGKTTLSEALLYTAGTIAKVGRVDHGSSYLDTFSLERERGITIFSKQAVIKYHDKLFTLLDTPGHVDFSAEAERTLSVLDYAILVISGTQPIQSHTVTLWRLLKKYNVPCFVFVNKTDLYGVDKTDVLNRLKEKLSENIVDFTYRNTDDFLDNLAVCSEELLESFTDNGTVTVEETAAAIKQRFVFPCLFGSALKLDGVDNLLDLIYTYTVFCKKSGDFGARIFKIADDGKGKRLTYMKITSGTLSVKDIPKSPKNEKAEKVDNIRIYSGEKFTQAQSVTQGTVCAVTGLSFTRPGDGLGIEADHTTPVLSPVMSYSVLPKDMSKIHALLDCLRILEDEDPQLQISWSEVSRTISVRLMGNIQLEVLKSVIGSRFGIDVEFAAGSIIYKETIADTVEGVGHFEPLRHYAEVHLLMKPAPPGSGVLISTQCKEDKLDRNWQRLIITHLYEHTHLGVLTGSPITDIEIILAAGKAHPKHTEGGDFRQATYRAVRQGLMNARSVLLEPYYDFILEVPTENVGRAMTDIQRMCGNFESPENRGEFTEISGSAPASTISSYSAEVTAYTHGKGRLTCTFKGYEPCHNADEVIEKFAYDPETDVDEPCDSVFCSHGAGHIVKWNEVPDHMHLPSVLEKNNDEDSSPADAEQLFSRCRTQSDIFALDKELMSIFERTYGKVRSRSDNSQSRRTSYDKDQGSYKRKGTKNYDGDEYVLVDGYNVIFAWDDLNRAAKTNIDAARNTLVNILCNYQGYKKCNLILIFDAYKVKNGVGSVEKIGGISVVYTKEAETADMYIEKVTHTLAKNNRVRVVTSDGLEQLIILGSGALRVSARSFREEIEQAEHEIRQYLSKYSSGV